MSCEKCSLVPSLLQAWERGYYTKWLSTWPLFPYTYNAVQCLRLCGEEVAASQACKSFLFACSTSRDARMPLPGAENDGSKKPKFEKDFIVLSEFSEQVGPIPIVSDNRKEDRGRGVWTTRVLDQRFHKAWVWHWRSSCCRHAPSPLSLIPPPST